MLFRQGGDGAGIPVIFASYLINYYKDCLSRWCLVFNKFYL